MRKRAPTAGCRGFPLPLRGNVVVKTKDPWPWEPFAKIDTGLGDNTVTRYKILASGDRLILSMWELECSFSIHVAERGAKHIKPNPLGV